MVIAHCAFRSNIFFIAGQHWLLLNYKNRSLSVRVKSDYFRRYTDRMCYLLAYQYYQQEYPQRYRQQKILLPLRIVTYFCSYIYNIATSRLAAHISCIYNFSCLTQVFSSWGSFIFFIYKSTYIPSTCIFFHHIHID